MGKDFFPNFERKLPKFKLQKGHFAGKWQA
jgi:hypothetical protein